MSVRSTEGAVETISVLSFHIDSRLNELFEIQSGGQDHS